MKKFLNLKKCIIQSKNQPVLLQTYLESIKSSCYKLSIPHQDHQQPYIHEASSPQLTAKINIPMYVNSFDNDATTGKKNNNKKVSGKQGDTQKIDDLFHQISSRFKAHQSAPNSHDEILNTILQQLFILEQNADFKEPIRLIRKIIKTMGSVENDISEHSNIKTMYQNTKIGTDNKDSLKSCFEIQQNSKTKFNEDLAGFNIKIKSIRKRDGKGRISKTEYDEEDDYPIIQKKIKFDIEKQKESSILQYQEESRERQEQYDKEEEKERNQFFQIKCKRIMPGQKIEGDYEEIQNSQSSQFQQSLQSNLNHQQQIHDDEEECSTGRQQLIQNQSLNNTMKSEDINGWSEQLYKISQLDEEDEIQSASVFHPFQSDHSQLFSSKQAFNKNNQNEEKKQEDQSIEFKKIRYMLQSQSTHKKLKQQKIKPKFNQNIRNFNQRIQNCTKQEINISKKETKQQNIMKQKQNRTNYEPLNKSRENQAKALKNKNKKNISEQHQNFSVGGNKKENPTEQLKNIVNLLNSKYQRNISFKI